MQSDGGRLPFARIRCALWTAAVLALAPAGAGGIEADQAFPIEVIGRDEIAKTGASSVTDLLNSLPTGPISPPTAAGWIPSLQGLPGTIVLVNGRRAAAAGVDLDAIPADAIQRVELLREGSSYAYGADAVAGVVNVILKRGFPFATTDGSAVLQDATAPLFAGPGGLAFDSNVECDFGRGAANPPFVFLPTYELGGPKIDGAKWTYAPGVGAELVPKLGSALWPWSRAGGEPLPRYVYPTPSAPVAPETTQINGPSWPKEFEGWRVPPWSMVQRSPECPEAVKTELAPLYAARDQARADWAYHMDFVSYANQAPQDKAADQAKAQEAQTRRLEVEGKIRGLIEKCAGGGTTTTAVTPPAAAGEPVEKVQIRIGQTFKGIGGALEWKASPNLRLDLYPFDYGKNWALPGDGAARNTEYGASEPALRRFTDGEGRIELDLDECDDHCPGCDICPDCECDDCYEEFGPPRYWFRVPKDVKLELASLEPERREAVEKPISALGGPALRLDWLKKEWQVELRYEPKEQRVVELSDGSGSFEWGTWKIDQSIRASIAEPLRDRISDAFKIGDKSYLSINTPESFQLEPNWLRSIRGYSYDENDECGSEAQPLAAEGAAANADGTLARVGLGSGADSAWKQLPADAAPIVVGVVDTGVDWNHADLAWDNLWRNPREIPGNRRDDDGNGYVDDVIGWDFVGKSNKPWDYDGHGTFVAGLIAATHGNGAGIDGVNPRVKIMVLKALNGFGHTRASRIAQAIVYGADNGARILNLSVAGPGLPRVVQNAVTYAESKGVLVIAAAGNRPRMSRRCTRQA